jgi:hypothetical protein
MARREAFSEKQREQFLAEAAAPGLAKGEAARKFAAEKVARVAPPEFDPDIQARFDLTNLQHRQRLERERIAHEQNLAEIAAKPKTGARAPKVVSPEKRIEDIRKAIEGNLELELENVAPGTSTLVAEFLDSIREENKRRAAAGEPLKTEPDSREVLREYQTGEISRRMLDKEINDNLANDIFEIGIKNEETPFVDGAILNKVADDLRYGSIAGAFDDGVAYDLADLTRIALQEGLSERQIQLLVERAILELHGGQVAIQDKFRQLTEPAVTGFSEAAKKMFQFFDVGGKERAAVRRRLTGPQPGTAAPSDTTDAGR